MGYGGFEMRFFWYAGYEFQKVGKKSGMWDWAPPPPLPPFAIIIFVIIINLYYIGFLTNRYGALQKTIIAHFMIFLN